MLIEKNRGSSLFPYLKPFASWRKAKPIGKLLLRTDSGLKQFSITFSSNSVLQGMEKEEVQVDYEVDEDESIDLFEC